MDAYWRTAFVRGADYLYDNPPLRGPNELKHIKPRLLGHWGTTPGSILFTCI
jgi:xylulose-5-phosphate/fructose-6-phosphate phosphoketolase